MLWDRSLDRQWKNMHTQLQLFHAVEPILEWSVGWSSKPYLTLLEIPILSWRRNPSNNNNGQSWWGTLELKEFRLPKEIFKEQVWKNLQKSSGIPGQSMDSLVKDFIKLQNLDGELMKNISHPMLKHSSMAPNVLFTWLNLVWPQE